MHPFAICAYGVGPILGELFEVGLWCQDGWMCYHCVQCVFEQCGSCKGFCIIVGCLGGTMAAVGMPVWLLLVNRW